MHKVGAYPGQTESLEGMSGQSRVNNVKMFGDDHIHTFVGPRSITNVTYDDHFLHPGFVIRSVFTSDNTVYIRTEGGGWGWNGSLNNQLKNQVWGPVDTRVIQEIKR